MKPATTVEKIARILQAFASRPVLGVTEAARIAGLLPSDAHRLLQSLRAVGFVEQDSSSRKYRLGLNLLRLGNQVHRHLEIAHCARPILRDLADRTKADANAAVLDPHLMEVFFVEQIPSTEFASGPRVGATVSPHATAVGKVLAAQLDRDARRALIEKHGMKKLTRKTITGFDALEAELEKVKEQGFAVDDEEAVRDASCLAVPVLGSDGRVAAAVSVSTTTVHLYQVGQEGLLRELRGAARKISRALGGS